MIDPVSVARQYVALSNEHAVDAALACFHPEATYHSSAQGTFEGIAAIRPMMEAFFARFPDIHWEVAAYRQEGTATAGFDFVATAHDAQTGEAITRKGTERISVAADGRICRVEVEVEVA